MSSQLGEAQIPIRATLDKLDADLAGAKGKIEKALSGVRDTAAKVGKVAFVSITAAILGIGAAGISSAATMDEQMSIIASNMNTTKEAVAPLADVIKDLGLDPNLKVTSLEAAQAIDMLARNGLTMTEIMDGAAKSTVLLANATGSTFDVAANIATDAMSTFGIEASKMQDAVDGIVSVTTNSKFSIDDYALALSQGGGVAATAGVEFDEFNASIAAISPLFASGSDAGTSFKTMITRLAAPTGEASALMNQLGLDFYDADGNMRSITEISGELNRALYGVTETMAVVGGRTAEQNKELERLQKMHATATQSIADYQAGIKGASLSEEARAKKIADLTLQQTNLEASMSPLLAISGEMVATTRELTEEQRTQALSTLFGADAMRAAAGLAGLADGEFESLMETMGQTDALANAATRMDTLSGVIEILQGIGESLLLSFGNGLLPMFRMFADLLLDLTGNAMPQIEAALGTISDTVASFTANLQEGMSPLDAFIEAIWDIAPQEVLDTLVRLRDEILPGLVSWFETSVQPMLDMVAGFVEWQDVAIAAAIAIGAIVIPIIWGILSPILAVIAVGAALVAAIALVRNAWENDWGGMRTVLTEIWKGTVQPALAMFVQWLGVNLPIALEKLRAFWVDTAWPAIQAAMAVAWEIVRIIFEAYVYYITDIFIPTVVALWDYWVNVAWPAIQEALATAWAFMQPILAAIGDWIINTLIPTVQDLWHQWVDVIWPAIQTALENAWTAIKAIWEELGRWINDNIVPWIEFLHEKWVEEVWPAIQKAIEDVWAIIEPIWESLRKYLKETLPPALEGLQKVFETVMSAIDAAIQPVKSLWDNLVDAVKGFWNWITSHKFEFKISIPDLPDWALPGSPLPIHTAWKNFERDMNQMTISPNLDLDFGGDGGGQRSTQFNIEANYGYQSERSLRDDIRMLQLLHET